MICTLTGANDFARIQALETLVADFIAEHTDMAVERFDGETAETARMRESIQSLPFLTTRKLVVLREPSKQKLFTETINELLGDVPTTTDVVIVEPKLDKRLSYYKTLKQITDFRDFPILDASGLARWSTEYVRQQGGEVSLSDARYLIDRVGVDQLLLQHELDKLMLFDTHITAKTIDQLTDVLPQSTVFELLDAAFAGKTAQALALYAEQRALRVEPQAIVAMLVWQMHILAVVKMAGARSIEEIAKQAKLNPYVVRKTHGLARCLTLIQIKTMVAELLDLDERLKSSSIDADEAVRSYLLRLGL